MGFVHCTRSVNSVYCPCGLGNHSDFHVNLHENQQGVHRNQCDFHVHMENWTKADRTFLPVWVLLFLSSKWNYLRWKHVCFWSVSRIHSYRDVTSALNTSFSTVILHCDVPTSTVLRNCTPYQYDILLKDSKVSP